MIHDPALALHTVKQSQQEHRDVATAHRLARTASGGAADATAPVRSSRRMRRPPRLRRPAVATSGLLRPPAHGLRPTH